MNVLLLLFSFLKDHGGYFPLTGTALAQKWLRTGCNLSSQLKERWGEDESIDTRAFLCPIVSVHRLGTFFSALQQRWCSSGTLPMELLLVLSLPLSLALCGVLCLHRPAREAGAGKGSKVASVGCWWDAREQ